MTQVVMAKLLNKPSVFSEKHWADAAMGLEDMEFREKCRMILLLGF